MARPAHRGIGTYGTRLASVQCMFTAQFILFGMVLAQLVDALTFTIGVGRFGIGIESNGIAAAVYHAFGLSGVLVMKGAVIVFAIGLMVLAAHRFPRLLVWGGAATTSMGLLGFVANSWSMAILG